MKFNRKLSVIFFALVKGGSHVEWVFIRNVLDEGSVQNKYIIEEL